MKRIKILFTIVITAVLLLQTNILRAQDNISTLYFIENSPMRHTLNPAFQPDDYKFYINIPGLGFDRLSLVNSNFTVKDFVTTNVDGKTITFMHPDGDKDTFYNKIKEHGPLATAHVGVNLLGFGLKTTKEKGYFTFGLDMKVDGDFSIAKDFFNLVLYGTPEINNNIYDLKNTRGNFNAYLDFAFGYSHKINEKWTVGGKARFLYGIANVNADFGKFDLSAGINKWVASGNGMIRFAGPFDISVGERLESLEIDISKSVGDFLKPSGFGFAFDVGVSYKPIEQLKLSLAVTDLGLINWNNVTNIMYSIDDFEFNGIQLSSMQDFFQFNMQDIGDSLYNALNSGTVIGETNLNYSTATHAKLLFGIEGNFFQNKLGVGILSKTTKIGPKFMEEVTFAVNGRPIQWANITLSYSLIHGQYSTFGFGLGLRSGPIHWMLTADYIPFVYAAYTPDESNSRIPVPYNSRGFNVGLGINVVIRGKKDTDKDGVADKFDLCPDTPLGVIVDASGCPLDSDGDGVPDYLDECPDTPPQAHGYIDEKGCPLDSDGDGVPDYLDRCPDTPKEAYNYIDEHGCPLDSDGDGVFDYLDDCPDTPKEAYNYIDEHGCPTDSDGDGVPDYLDECPDTPEEAHDFIDEKGCPKDTDGDTVPDYLDDCPRTPGPASNNGCPEIKTEVRTLIEKAMQGIQFETSKSTIRSSSYKLLNDIAVEFVANPEYIIEIQGHTDNTGKVDFNQKLSQDRANSVMKYLVDKGVPAERMTAVGYGITKPIDDNKTAAGRARNRRVEFLITYEEVHFE